MSEPPKEVQIAARAYAEKFIRDASPTRYFHFGALHEIEAHFLAGAKVETDAQGL